MKIQTCLAFLLFFFAGMLHANSLAVPACRPPSQSAYSGSLSTSNTYLTHLQCIDACDAQMEQVAQVCSPTCAGLFPNQVYHWYILANPSTCFNACYLVNGVYTWAIDFNCCCGTGPIPPKPPSTPLGPVVMEDPFFTGQTVFLD